MSEIWYYIAGFERPPSSFHHDRPANLELREDGSVELREDTDDQLREGT